MESCSEGASSMKWGPQQPTMRDVTPPMASLSRLGLKKYMCCAGDKDDDLEPLDFTLPGYPDYALAGEEDHSRIIQDFSYEQRHAFLQFMTGVPRSPPGGPSTLNPEVTIVHRVKESSF